MALGSLSKKKDTKRLPLKDMQENLIDDEEFFDSMINNDELA